MVPCWVESDALRFLISDGTWKVLQIKPSKFWRSLEARSIRHTTQWSHTSEFHNQFCSSQKSEALTCLCCGNAETSSALFYKHLRMAWPFRSWRFPTFHPLEDEVKEILQKHASIRAIWPLLAPSPGCTSVNQQLLSRSGVHSELMVGAKGKCEDTKKKRWSTNTSMILPCTLSVNKIWLRGLQRHLPSISIHRLPRLGMHWAASICWRFEGRDQVAGLWRHHQRGGGRFGDASVDWHPEQRDRVDTTHNVSIHHIIIEYI